MTHFVLLPLIVSLFSALTEPEEIEILFAGDAMQHESQLNAARRNDGSFDYSDCFGRIAPYVRSADYAVVNLECPLGGKPYSGYPMFCAPDEFAVALRDAGFDLALNANNHTLDRRDKGLARTISVLDSIGLRHTGTYSPAESLDSLVPFIADIKGFKVAFLNYTYGTNGIRHGRGVAVDYIDTAKIRRDITSARECGAEVVAVCPHWGLEYHLLPEKSQRLLAAQIKGMGADMVIGAHPHVVQPMELLTDTTGRRTLTVYSLGNFISGMRTIDTRGGAVVTVGLRRDENGRPVIDHATYRTVFTVAPSGKNCNYRLIFATDSIEDATLDNLRQEFDSRSREVFDKHNVNVASDTTQLAQLLKERALRTNFVVNDEN